MPSPPTVGLPTSCRSVGSCSHGCEHLTSLVPPLRAGRVLCHHRCPTDACRRPSGLVTPNPTHSREREVVSGTSVERTAVRCIRSRSRRRSSRLSTDTFPDGGWCSPARTVLPAPIVWTTCRGRLMLTRVSAATPNSCPRMVARSSGSGPRRTGQCRNRGAASAGLQAYNPGVQRSLGGVLRACPLCRSRLRPRRDRCRS